MLFDWKNSDKSKVNATIGLLAFTIALGGVLLVALFSFVCGYVATKKKFLRVLAACMVVRGAAVCLYKRFHPREKDWRSASVAHNLSNSPEISRHAS